MTEQLYNDGYNFLTHQDEVEVMLSVMTDGELMSLKDRVELMIKEGVYSKDGFPLSCGGLRFLIATIMFAFWCRKGKGVKLVEGEVVVCELKESPFWERYQPPPFRVEFDPESPEHERDQTDVEEVVDASEKFKDRSGRVLEEEGEWI